MKEEVKRIALIDPVGRKAGMDHYDLLLLEGIEKTGLPVTLYSNFSHPRGPVHVMHVFHNLNTTKIRSVTSTFTGFIRSLLHSKKNNTGWLILHVFRAGLFDLFTFALARLMGFKICAIIHDIESLDTITLPFVRKMVIDYLPNKRVVHNDFSLQQLALNIRPSARSGTFVIPHVNFIDLFEGYQQDPGSLERLKEDGSITETLSKGLGDYIRGGGRILLFFGQIKNAKGLDTLLKAVAVTEGNYKLIIAGRVREGSWSQYEKTISSLNIANRIIPVIRFINDRERDFLFSISHAIILPYTRIYQSGVLLMAMSFPKTVIASDLPPNTDIVSHMKNGLVFRAGDAADLSEKIKYLLEHPESVSLLSQKAIEDIRSGYNPWIIGEKFSALLRGQDVTAVKSVH